MFEFQLPADAVSKATMILCVKVSMLLGVAWLMQLLLRHQHAAWRILLWRLSAVGMVTLLMTCHRTPWIQLALHQPTATVTQSQKTGAFPVIPSDVNTAETTDPWTSEFEPTQDQRQSPSLSPSPISVAIAPLLPAPMPTGNTQFAPVVSREGWRWPNGSHVAMVLWSIGVVLGFLRMSLGQIQLQRYVRNSQPAPAWWLYVAAESNVPDGFQTRIRRSSQIATPCSFGIFRPVILLPSSMTDRHGRHQVAASLAHEWSHVRNADLAWNVLLHGLSILFWFHPLAWRMRLAHVDACDERCDADAAKRVGGVDRYQQVLAAMTLQAIANPLPGMLTMARRTSIRRRMESLASGVSQSEFTLRRTWTSISLGSACVAILIVVGVGGPAAQSQVAGADADADPTEPTIVAAPDPDSVPDPEPGFDLYADPLPTHAVARYGSTRYQHGDSQTIRVEIVNGNQYVCHDSGATLLVGDIRSGKAVRRVNVWGEQVVDIAATADGSKLFVLSGNSIGERRMRSVIRAFDTKTWLREEDELDLRSEAVVSPAAIDVDASGDIVAFANRLGTVHVYDWNRKTLQHRLEPDKPVNMNRIAVAPAGDAIATFENREVYLWRLATEPERIELQAGPTRPNAVAFSPDGRRVFLGGEDASRVHAFDVQTGNLVGSTARRHEGNTRQFDFDIVFSPDGSQFYVPNGSKMEAYDANNMALTKVFDNQLNDIERIAITSDGKFLVGNNRTSLTAWNLETDQCLASKFSGGAEGFAALATSKSGKYAATATTAFVLEYWEIATGRVVRRFQHDKRIRAVAISPDERWLVANSLDNTVRMWDLTTGAERFRLPGHGRFGGSEYAVAFSEDGKTCYSFGRDLYLRSYDTESGKVLSERSIWPSGLTFSQDDWVEAKLSKEPLPGLSASFSPNGDRLFVAASVPLANTYVFDVKTGKELRSLPDVYIRQFRSNNANYIPALERQRVGDVSRNVLKLLDSHTFQIVASIPLFGAGIATVVTNDNQYLIDGFYGLRSDRKPALVVHEIETGDLVASIDLDGPMHTIAISDDDQHLITGHFDGTVLVWDFASLLQGNERSSSP